MAERSAEILLALAGGYGVAGLLVGLAFVPLGVIALLILFALAATSQDVWLSLLTPRGWKALHMAIYPAYALVVAHVAFGALRDAASPVLAAVMVGSAAGLVALHLAAALRQRQADTAAPMRCRKAAPSSCGPRVPRRWRSSAMAGGSPR